MSESQGWWCQRKDTRPGNILLYPITTITYILGITDPDFIHVVVALRIKPDSVSKMFYQNQLF